jgi:hypothetical protein
MREYSPKAPTEILPLGVDLTPLLATGEALLVVAASLAVIRGTDPAPADMLLGSATIAGAVAQQWVQGGVDGCRYQLRFDVDTDVGKHLLEVGEFEVATK